MYHPVISTLAAGRPTKPNPPRFDSWAIAPTGSSPGGRASCFPVRNKIQKRATLVLYQAKNALHPMSRPPVVISSVLVFIQFGDGSRNLLVLRRYKALPGSFGSVASVATQGYSFFFWRSPTKWVGPYQVGGGLIIVICYSFA